GVCALCSSAASNGYKGQDLSLQADFIKIAEGFGCEGYNIKTKDEFRTAFKQALESNKTSLLNVFIDRFEDMLPMVPAGGATYNLPFIHISEPTSRSPLP
ncbi:thiamine pyrophosphate-dependent enzyme, partial [Campylobacter jejuni]|uniref:thiamine pyrophosphate-dependent enzyme n=1 Tax=Campylobacter jejuni TaxID=197 RepID=UPI002044348F